MSEKRRTRKVTFSVWASAIVLFLLVSLLASRLANAASARDVVISEIAWMGTTTDANDEWLELYNNTSADIDLNNWKLASQDGSPTIALTGTIPAHGYYLLERTDDTSTPQLADQIYSGALNNTGEVLTLTDHLAGKIDVAGVLGNPWFAGNNTTKATMARTVITGDGTLASSWGDGPVNGTPTNSQVDRDGDTYTWSPNLRYPGWDCDDNDPTTYPGAPEVLDLKDNNCDGQIDEGLNLGPFTYNVYFNGDTIITATHPTTQATQMESALIDMLHTTTSTLDLALYDFTRESLRDAILDAKARGVTVRVVVDDDTYSGASAPMYQSLVISGVTVITDSRSSSLQHNKFAISDKARVWTGSVNWSDTDISYNANNAILITDTHIAQAYTTEFEEMFVQRKFSIHKADNTTHVFSYTNTLVESYFSPSDATETHIITALQTAQSGIYFAMFFWTSNDLARVVISKAVTEGVTVAGVVDAVGASNVSSQDDELCAAGIPVKIETFGGKVHNKFAVIDPFGSDPTVILGSHNWTASADQDNDENTLIVHDAALAQAYYQEYLRLYNVLPADTICVNHGAEWGLAACTDGIDNDYDGLIDFEEQSCRDSVKRVFLPVVER